MIRFQRDVMRLVDQNNQTFQQSLKIHSILK